MSQCQADRTFALDEARFGLKVWHRRRWCPKGFRPPWVVDDRYDWVWLYAAVEPMTGESFFLFLPRLDGICFQIFLEEFRNWFAADDADDDEKIALVLDGSPSHRNQAVEWPQGLSAIPLPAYSPELNPAEGIFKEIRGELSNEVFETVDAIEDGLLEVIQEYWEEPERLQRLTAYPWWVAGVERKEYIKSPSQ